MISKLVDECKKNIWNLIIIVSIIIFFFINLYDLKYKFNLENLNGIKYYLFFSLVSVALCIVIFLLNKFTNKKIEEKIHKVFLISALVLGSIFLFLSPLFTGSDEHNHYYRIYEITEGTFVTPTDELVGSKMPSSLQETFEVGKGHNTKVKYKNLIYMNKIKLNENNTKQYGDLWSNSYSNTALYSPVQYLPQVIGFMIGKLLNFNPLMMGMLGRLFNLLFYILIGYFALKIIPKGKLFYLFILISPNMLQCASTLSADAFTNGIFLLIISIFLNICYQNKKIKRSEEILLFVLSVLISLCKIVYLPIVLLLTIISKDKFEKGKKEKIIFNVVTLVFSVIVSLLWIRCTGGVFNIDYDKTELQKQFILSNIFEYFIIFMRTYSINIVKYIECLFVGTTMYHGQLQMPIVVSFIYIIIVVLALIKDKNENHFIKIYRILIFLIALMIIGLISTAIYVQCTAQYFAVGNEVIQGIQGRYFIPIIFLLPLLIKPIKNRIKIDVNLMYKIILAINLITYLYMLNQFIR